MKQVSKPCITCNTLFFKKYYESRATWDERKYCSLPCRQPWNRGLNKSDPRVANNWRNSQKTRFSTESTSGTKNAKWKGVDASYEAKHMWVKYHYGKPQECEHCGTTKKRMYHWANISKECMRDRSDWLRLCVPCHKRFDLDRLI